MKLLLVINVADDVAEAYEDFTVDYDLRGTPKDDQKVNESIKYVEDCPIQPMPEPKYVEVNEIEDLMHTEFSIENFSAKIRLDTEKIFSLGWNACLIELEDSQNGEDSNE